MPTSKPPRNLEVIGDPVSDRQWCDLAQRVGGSFTERPAYVRATADLPLGGRQLPGASTAVAAIVDGDVARAVIGLRILRGGPLHFGSTAGHRLGLVGDALVDGPDSAGALLDLLRRNRLALTIDRIPTHSPFLDALRRRPDWRVEEKVVDESAVLTLAPGGSARDIRGGRSLKRLRTALRAVEREHGPVEFVSVTTADDLASRWADLQRVSALRTASMPGRLDYLAEPLASLVESTLTAEARAGRLLITGILVGDTWSAHEISLRSGRTLYSWLSHFDPRIAAAQPGHQLMVHLADKHDDLGFDRLDHGAGINSIKRAWSGADSYSVSKVRAVPTGPRGRLQWAVLQARDTLRDRRTAGTDSTDQANPTDQADQAGSTGSGSDTTTMPSSSE